MIKARTQAIRKRNNFIGIIGEDNWKAPPRCLKKD
jgi:hypothetical protein